MNKSELIEVLSSRLGGRAQAAAAVEALVDVVLREVAAGRSVGITGFGTFEKVDRAPRTGRNPRTGEAVPIAGTSTPRFRPGAYFKDVVADPSALPAQGLAGARVGSSDGVERTGAPATVRRTEKAAGPSADKTTKATGTAKTTKATGGGAPESVRKAPQTSAPRVGQGKKSSSEKPATGRVMAGGEEITHGMISAKKAQLARVKNDELAAKNKKKNRATAAQKVEGADGADPETSKAKGKSKDKDRAKLKPKVKSKDKLKPKDKGRVKSKPKDKGKAKSEPKDKLKPKKGAKTNKDKGKGSGKQK